MTRRLSAAAVALAIAGTGAARAAGPNDERPPAESFFERVWRAAVTELEAAAAARQPELVPPEPIEVSWRPRRMASVDLNAPLLSLRAGDVDVDGKAELVALTSREVIVLRPADGGGLAIAARAPLPAARPALRPRDPVGTLVIGANEDGVPPEILARSSGRARGVALVWNGGALEERRQLDDFPLCAGAMAALVPGRNYFAAGRITWQEPKQAPELRGELYGAECARGLVDAEGRPLRSFAWLATDGALTVRIETVCPAGDPECAELAPRESSVGGVGVAFAVADVDNDGRPEVISSSDRPPGDPDKVTVQSARGSRWKPIFERGFSGGVAGLVAADLDGDGDDDVVAGVRLIGSERVDFWRLNQ